MTMAIIFLGIVLVAAIGIMAVEFTLLDEEIEVGTPEYNDYVEYQAKWDNYCSLYYQY